MGIENVLNDILVLFKTGGASFSATPSKSANIDDAADITLNNGAETTIVAANATTREVIIVADPANTLSIRIGKTAQVGAARGALLGPGASLTLTTSAQICGWATAAGQKVSILIVKD